MFQAEFFLTTLYSLLGREGHEDIRCDMDYCISVVTVYMYVVVEEVLTSFT